MESVGKTAMDNSDELEDRLDPTNDGDAVDEVAEPGLGFDDHKAPGAFRTIGEVARALGIRQHVLRYWEEQFPMLNPVKRSGNRRYYRPEDVALIETIDRLVHHQGFTLRGARLALEGARKKPKGAAAGSPTADTADPSSAANDVQPQEPAEPAPWVDELLAIRATLAAALAT